MSLATPSINTSSTTLTSAAVIAVAILTVYFQCSFDAFRNITGVQFDLLPGLMVYAALTTHIGTLATLAIVAGLCHDSLSANPLGVTILPLFIVGLGVQYCRPLVLRDQALAQTVLGAAASAAAPLLSLLLLLNGERQPLLGWGSLWHWLVIAVIGGTVTPLWFLLFARITRAVSYRPDTPSSFRPDRQIKRGRS